MDKQVTKIVKRCLHCGGRLNNSRIDDIMREADKSLEKYQNKMRKKK